MTFSYSPWLTSAVPDVPTLISTIQSDHQSWGAKILVYDRDLNPVAANVFAGRASNDLTPAFALKNVTNDSSQDVARTAELEVRESELGGFPLSALNHRLRVYLERYDGTHDAYGNPNAILSVPIGTFRAWFPDRDITTGTDVAVWSNASWHDGTQDLANLIFWNDWNVAAGSAITDVAKAILLTDRLPPSQGGRTSPNPGLTPSGCDFLGPDYSPQQVAGLWPASNYPSLATLSGIQSSTLTTPVATSWTDKDNVYAALKNFAATIGWYGPWADPMNGLTMRQKNYYGTTLAGSTYVPDSCWSFTVGSSSGPTETSIIKSIKQRFDGVANVRNAVKVKVHPNSGTPFEYAAYNTSSSSSVNIGAIGGIPLVIEDNQIPDMTTAQLRALLELQSRSMLAEQLEIIHTPVPWMMTETHGVCDINVYTWQGALQITTSGGGYPFEIVRCSLDMSNPNQPMMSSLLSRAIPV